MTNEIDSKLFRKALHLYPCINEIKDDFLYNICSVTAFSQDDGSILVEIVTHTPGFLIGKAGKQVGEIKQLMSEMSGHPIAIDIKESNLFYDLYD